MSDEDKDEFGDALPREDGLPSTRNTNAPYSLDDPNLSYNFKYGQAFRIALDPVILFQDFYNRSGKLIRQQLHTPAGQRGPTASRGGKVNTELFGDMQKVMEPIIIRALLANYDRMIGSKGTSGEHTGALRLAVGGGTFESLSTTYESFSMKYKLGDEPRNRPARKFGKTSSSPGGSNSTLKYGPVIFKGRGSIESGNRMVFPKYPGDGTKGIFTKRVRGVPPQNIFKLSDGQIKALKMAVIEPIKKHIVSRLREV